ncbi:hypothetical protein EOD42_10490 [Rhodovarius crocodyli]|uniref:Class I SAM-dependent methyltransferase n=1 Tax=Rhodovarius crocodyli TaxID=1979269 RepID=A0A437MGQ1_9PROT|nr:hypothetical protein EOD42_10490 [Rhodovarius crocodyli]
MARVLDRLLYAPSVIRKRLEAAGVALTRADRYGALPSIEALEASFAHPSLLRLEEVFPAPAVMRTFLLELEIQAREFHPPAAAPSAEGYGWHNDNFAYSDPLAYYAMLRKFRPRTVIEVGSGDSALVALAALRANGAGRLISVTENPPEHLRGLPGLELIEAPLQSVETAFFTRNLGQGDVLFLDTSHTVKHDSDAVHALLRVVPALRHQAFIHLHDIALPETRPLGEMREHQVFWTEQYLLAAYLRGNPRCSVLYGSAWHMKHNEAGLRAFMAGRFAPGGGSFWFSQLGA